MGNLLWFYRNGNGGEKKKYSLEVDQELGKSWEGLRPECLPLEMALVRQQVIPWAQKAEGQSHALWPGNITFWIQKRELSS